MSTEQAPSAGPPPKQVKISAQCEMATEWRGDYLYIEYTGVFDLETAVRAAQVAREVILSCALPIDMVVNMTRAEYGDHSVLDIVVAATKDNTTRIRRSAVIDREHGAKRYLAEVVLERSGRDNVDVVGSLEEAEAFIRAASGRPGRL